MENKKTLAISGGMILSMSPASGIIEKGYIICRGDRIQEIGKGPCPLRIKSNPGTQLIEAEGQLIMPGLINTHTHAAMSLLAGIADDLPLMEWLNDFIFPLEAEFMSPGFVYAGTQLSGLAMIRSGTTTLADGYFFESAAAEAINDLGMRGIMAQGILDFPNPQYKTPEQGLKAIKDFIQKWQGAKSGLIRPALFCHSPYTCSSDTLLKASDLSRQTSTLFMIHLAETKDEVDIVKQRYGTTPVRHLENLGVLGPHVLAVHCVWLDDEEIQILAKHRVKVAHCPESNMKLAAGIAPVPGLLKKGVCVSIGTDGCASNNNLDLFCEIDFAAKLHKVSNMDPTEMDAGTVLEMATIKAAHAIGMQDEIGSLEPGKKADILCLDLNQPHLTPLYNIHSQLVYAASGMDVDTVIVDGILLMKNRRFIGLDIKRIFENGKGWMRRIRAKRPA